MKHTGLLKISAFSLLFLFLTSLGYAQNFEINNETVTTCTGSFLDDNGGVGDAPGTGGADYSGTSYTYTICPDTPGDVILVDFALFNVYQAANFNNSDFLQVFDGDNTTAGSLGSYTGNDLQGLSIEGTVNNVSGCLTFRFIANAGSPGTFGGWEAFISCTTPCDSPVSAGAITNPVPEMPNSVSVCLNEEVTFSDIGSFPQSGFTIENYIWNLDDGTVIEGEQEITHAFTEPGEYIVTLTVVDNNGCQNSNLTPLRVLVSTLPIFNTEFSPEICLGATGFVDAAPVQSVTWTSIGPQNIAGETFLPDDAGSSYESSLVFDFFDDGQVVESCDDLLGLNINMEHSYMGDLQIQISCPNDTTVVLVEYPNGGGGTFIGDALDDGTNDPGVGFDYTWSPTAVNGAWGDNSGGVDVLPSGTYESDYDLCSLVGCPLNGEWTIVVIDNIGADNGYIFGWGIDFDQSLFPEPTEFTPVVGLGLDSTFVEGPFVTNTSSDGNQIDVFPTETGSFEYTVVATNNFGCAFDTTLVIEVVSLVDIDISTDTTICQNGIAALEANLFGPEAANATVLWNGGVFEGENIMVQPAQSPMLYEAQAFYGDGCYSDAYEVIVDRYAPLQMFGQIDEIICLGDSVVVTPNSPTGGLEPYNFEWGSNLEIQTGETVTLKPELTTEYCVEFSDACESTPTEECFTIQLNPIISTDFTATDNTGCTPIATQFFGTADDTGLISSVIWEFGDGSTANTVNQANHAYLESGVYDVSLTITGTDGCVYSNTEEDLVDAYVLPNAEFQPGSFSTVLPNTMFEFENLSSFNDLNTWTFDAFGTSTEEHPEFEFPTEDPGQFEVQLVTETFQGCVDTVKYFVYVNNGFSLFAPNAFTPDGDGFNEVWKIEGIDIDESEFSLNVFNRNGEVVFQTNDKDAVWDGSHQNGDHYVPNGVYVFQIITRTLTTGDKKELSGHITIMR